MPTLNTIRKSIRETARSTGDRVPPLDAYHYLRRTIKRSTLFVVRRSVIESAFGVHYGYKLSLRHKALDVSVKAYIPGVCDVRNKVFCTLLDRLRVCTTSCVMFEDLFKEFIAEKKKEVERLYWVEERITSLHGTSLPDSMPYYAQFMVRFKMTKDAFDSMKLPSKIVPNTPFQAADLVRKHKVRPYVIGGNLPQLTLETWHTHLRGGHKLVLIPDVGRAALWAYLTPWPGVPESCQEQKRVIKASFPRAEVITKKHGPKEVAQFTNSQIFQNGPMSKRSCLTKHSYNRLTPLERMELRRYALGFGERKPSSIWHPDLKMFCNHGFAARMVPARKPLIIA